MNNRELHGVLATSNWDEVRNEKNFDLVVRSYGFGERNTYVPKDPRRNLMLQYSRGVVDSSQSYEDLVATFQDEVTSLRESDLVRIRELDAVLEKCSEAGVAVGSESFCEIGFRTPKLMRHYSPRFKRTAGFDIARFNVDLAREMGYDCRPADLNDASSPLPAEEFDLLVCYHVLEHTFDPIVSLGHIASSLRPGGFLHIETPVEPGVPRLRYGHLIALEEGDLARMLDAVGLRRISFSNATHTAGPHVERITAMRV